VVKKYRGWGWAGALGNVVIVFKGVKFGGEGAC